MHSLFRALASASWTITALALTGLCGLGTTAAAAAELHITPSVTTSQEYDSNYYRTTHNATSVWATEVRPGVKISALTAKSRLSLDYQGWYSWYHTLSGPRDTSNDNYFGNSLTFSAATRQFTRLTLGIDDYLMNTREPSYLDQYTQIVNRSEYVLNRVTPYVHYDLGPRGGFTLGYRNEVVKYLSTQGVGLENSSENRGMLTLTYNMDARNHIDFANQYWQRNYNGNVTSDYNAYQGELIYRRDFNTYLHGDIGAGYQWRHYAQGTLGNVGGYVYHLGVTAKSDISTLRLTFSHNINDFTQQNGYFKAYLVNFYAERLVMGRFRPFLGGYYQRSNYTQSAERDNTYQVYGGLGYLFWHKRLELSAEYQYEKLDSNIAGIGYSDNRVFLRLTAHYDFPRG